MRPRRLLVVALVGTVLLASAPGARGVSEGERAYALMRAARYPEAIEEFRKVLARSPSAGLQEDLARTLVSAGRYDEAVNEYQSLLATRPNDRELRRSLARALVSADRRVEAIPLFDGLIQENARDAGALTERALIARWQGDFETARRLLAEAGGLEPEPAPTAAPEDAAAAGELAPAAPGRDLTFPLLFGLIGIAIVIGQRRRIVPGTYLLLVGLTGVLVGASLAWLSVVP
jgi:tetratricopeptide (TPR) repeat protein